MKKCLPNYFGNHFAVEGTPPNGKVRKVAERKLPVFLESSSRVLTEKCSGIWIWGQNDYLPNFYSRRIVLGNFNVFLVYAREVLGEPY